MCATPLQDTGGGDPGSPGGGGGSGGGTGGTGNGQHGNFDHNDQLLTVYFGYDPTADDYTQLVPGEWEAYQDYTSGPWTEASRMFGAFVVANLNDSDSDQIVDYQDSSVIGNERTAEPDLIKLVINIPDWGPHYQCSVEAFHTNFTTNTTTATEAIRFFGTKTKGSLNGTAGITPWPGNPVDPQNPSYTPAKGFSITEAGTYIVYAEVSAASDHICDYDIRVLFSKPETTTSDGEYDQVNVTGIWAEVPEDGFIAERTLFEIKQVGNIPHKYYFNLFDNGGNLNAPFPEGLPNTGDVVTVYDDDFQEGQGIYEAPGFKTGTGHARVWLQMRVLAVAADNVGQFMFLEVLNSSNKGFTGFISVGDKIGYSLSGYVKSQDVLKLSDELAGQISADRYAPSWRPGMEITFIVKPKEVAFKPMSNNVKAAFDITRQKRFVVFNTQVPSPSITAEYPHIDELPNDDTTGKDEDCSQLENQEGRLIAIDFPGHGNTDDNRPQEFKFARSEYSGITFTIESEYREFVRADLRGVPRPIGADGHNLWGSRCSVKYVWYMNSDIIGDGNRPVEFTTFYAKPDGRHQIGKGSNPAWEQD